MRSYTSSHNPERKCVSHFEFNFGPSTSFLSADALPLAVV